MHIESIELRNFGCLRERRFELAPGLNVIKGPNEAGKSTLQAAILTALFVKPTSDTEELKARRSWGTEERFRLALELAAPAGRFLLEKDFQARTARLAQSDGGSVVADVNAVQATLERDLGLRSPSLFQSTACIPQEQLADIKSGRDEITALLERQVTGAGDEATAGQALGDLGEEVRKLSVGLHDTEPKRPGPIRRLRDEIEKLKQELTDAESGLGRTERGRRELEQAEQEAAALEQDLAVKEALLEKAGKRRELEQALAQATRRCDELDERLEAIGKLQQQREQAAQRVHQRSRIAEHGPGALTTIAQHEAGAKGREEEAARAEEDLRQAEEAEAAAAPPVPIFNRLTIAGLALVAVAAAAGFAYKPLWAAVLPGLALILWGLLRAHSAPQVDYVQRKSEAAKRAYAAQQAAEQSREAARAAAAQLGCQTPQELRERVEEAQKAAAEAERLRAEIKGLLAGRDPGQLQEEHRQARGERQGLEDRLADSELAGTELDPQQYEALRQEIARARSRQADLQRQADESRLAMARAEVDPEEVSALREHLSAAQDRLLAHEHRLAVYELAREAIAEARGETLRQATDVLAPRLGELLAPLTGDRYARVEVDEKTLEIRVWSAAKDGYIAVGESKDARRQRIEQSEMSAGTRAQAFLAARLALVDLIWPQDRPPLLLDDPLVSFDPHRQQAAAALLKTYARDGQVLLFTCSHAYDSFADRIIEL